MTSFEAGFVKYAEECGLSDQKTAHILKRAMEHPGVQNMFKVLPEEVETQSPHNLASLGELLKQHLIDEDMGRTTKKIQF